MVGVFSIALPILLFGGSTTVDASPPTYLSTKTPLSRPTPTCTSQSSPAAFLAQYGRKNNALGATVFSLIYGIPLYYFNKSFGGAEKLLAVRNRHTTPSTLANASFDAVAYPNVDTQYSYAVIDLSQNNLIFSLPSMQEDRLYLFDFWDPFGSQYAAIGSIQGSIPGQYLLRPTLHSNNYGVHPCDGYQGCISSPTMDGVFVIRVEVKNNSTDLHPATGFAPLAPEDFLNLPDSTDLATLNLLARLATRNPPWACNQAQTITKIFAMAGISHGKYTPPKGVNPAKANTLFQTKINETAKAARKDRAENNGWSIINPLIQGQFENGTDYLERGYFGIRSYLQNTATEALYPSYNGEDFSLDNSTAYLLDFSGKPPVASNGFWSVTAYGQDTFLIANLLNVYSVGDRSNIPYPNGKLVYPNYPNTTFNSTSFNAPFQLLVQGVDVPPPSNWSHNWLPVPSNGSVFTLTFRVYDPTEALVDASYSYPKVSKQSAIRDGSY